MARDDIHTKLSYHLDCKGGGVLLEEHNATVVPAQRQRFNDPVSGRYLGVDAVLQFCLLK